MNSGHPQGWCNDKGGGRPLSHREQQVLTLVAEGLLDKEVAERLLLSPKTVSAHLCRIRNKLDLHRRVELARYAYHNGYVKA